VNELSLEIALVIATSHTIPRTAQFGPTVNNANETFHCRLEAVYPSTLLVAMAPLNALLAQNPVAR
jgi:hypothetical protein